MTSRAPARRISPRQLPLARDKYSKFCVDTFPDNIKINELKVVLDCANGATYRVAPEVFRQLGIDITVINDNPDGLNINKDAGSVHPTLLQNVVLKENADLGIAFDGDGDRLIMVDGDGHLVDGDQVLYLILKFYQQQNNMSGGVVGTLMTNLALEEKCKELNVPFIRADVGDKYVAEALRKKRWIIGGENSGHIVLIDKHSTGDGIISALQLIAFLVSNKVSLNKALKEFPMYPQELINIPFSEQFDADSQEVILLIDEANRMMEMRGRILIRPSGTQPIIRVMTEGPDCDLVLKSANFLAESIKTLYL